MASIGKFRCTCEVENMRRYALISLEAHGLLDGRVQAKLASSPHCLKIPRVPKKATCGTRLRRSSSLIRQFWSLLALTTTIQYRLFSEDVGCSCTVQVIKWQGPPLQPQPRLGLTALRQYIFSLTSSFQSLSFASSPLYADSSISSWLDRHTYIAKTRRSRSQLRTR